MFVPLLSTYFQANLSWLSLLRSVVSTCVKVMQHLEWDSWTPVRRAVLLICLWPRKRCCLPSCCVSGVLHCITLESLMRKTWYQGELPKQMYSVAFSFLCVCVLFSLIFCPLLLECHYGSVCWRQNKRRSAPALEILALKTTHSQTKMHWHR